MSAAEKVAEWRELRKTNPVRAAVFYQANLRMIEKGLEEEGQRDARAERAEELGALLAIAEAGHTELAKYEQLRLTGRTFEAAVYMAQHGMQIAEQRRRVEGNPPTPPNPLEAA